MNGPESNQNTDSDTDILADSLTTDADSSPQHFSIPKQENVPLLSQSSEEEDVAFSRTDHYTVEDAVENMGFGFLQLKIFFICGMFSATDALEMLLLSVLSPALRCDWMLSDSQVASLTTIVFIGMFLGSNIWGKWADKFGRLPVLKIASVWILYFGLLTTFSPNYYWILILRGLVGCAFGGAVQSFTLQSEYLPSKHRAKTLILINFMWAAGSTFEVLMAYLIIPHWGWRALVAVSALPMLITICLVWYLPESARYLVAAGHKQEAVRVLEKASKCNGRTLPRGQLAQTKLTPQGRYRDLFGTEYRRTTLQLWFLWFGTASAYYGIILAQSEILERNDVCSDVREEQHKCHCNPLEWDDYLSMIFATLGEFVVIPFNLITIDTIGRRYTLLLNYVCTTVFFLLVQICTTKVILTLFIFGVRTFSAGNFNAVYIYTSEVYPTTVRSLGLGSCSALARIGAMLTPFIAQVLMPWSVKFSLWMYGLLCASCGICAALLPIETKGREMPQTQRC